MSQPNHTGRFYSLSPDDAGLLICEVLVVQVDVVRTEPLQRALDRGADVVRAAVDDAGPAAGVGHQAEFRRQHDLIAPALDGPADQLLVEIRAVDLGGVDVGDAQIERPVDGPDLFGLAALPRVVVARHRHGAKTDPRYVEST